MGNIMDYLDWRGDLTFAQSPFNEVDNLILAQLAYLNFDFIVPPERSGMSVTVRRAAEQYFRRYSEDQIRQFSYLVRITIPLLKKMAACPRFADAKLSNFQNMVDIERTKQFAAMHIELPDDTVYVSYRGTDNTIIGWKENFNMSIMTPVPAQFEALRYLEDTAAENDAPLRLGGHSKGGNLAVYAAVMCRPDVKRRILEVYNNDGPGFDAKITRSAAYQEMLGKIRTIIPQSSIVGMLLEHEEEYTVVKSSQTILMQHEAFSWEVLGTGFVRAEQVAKQSELLDMTLKSWLNQLDRAQRIQFVTALFHIFESADIWTLEDLTRAKWKKVREIIRVLNQSQENKAILVKAFRMLFQEGRKAFLASRSGGQAAETKAIDNKSRHGDNDGNDLMM
jgi:hypothetical protein